MGIHPNVGFDKFPRQGQYLNKSCSVCFNYDTSKYTDGVIIRDDAEDPWLLIIKLVDDRIVLSTECMYHPT